MPGASRRGVFDNRNSIQNFQFSTPNAIFQTKKCYEALRYRQSKKPKVLVQCNPAGLHEMFKKLDLMENKKNGTGTTLEEKGKFTDCTVGIIGTPQASEDLETFSITLSSEVLMKVNVLANSATFGGHQKGLDFTHGIANEEVIPVHAKHAVHALHCTMPIPLRPLHYTHCIRPTSLYIHCITSIALHSLRCTHCAAAGSVYGAVLLRQ